MELVLTGAETADQLIKQLVYIRALARQQIQRRRLLEEREAKWKQIAEQEEAWAARASEHQAHCAEQALEIRFIEIEIGNYLIRLCPELDKKVSREALFEAINTNRGDRDTELVHKYGSKASGILFVLNLENSGTQDDDITVRPLHWCYQMAFMHEMQTNAKLDRIVHDSANEFFNGVFGEYRERPLMERLAGRAV